MSRRFRKEDSRSRSSSNDSSKLRSKYRSSSVDHRDRKRKLPLETLEKIENEVAQEAAKIIKKKANEEVARYLESTDFVGIVEILKRRERERVLQEVKDEIAIEKQELIQKERARMIQQHEEKLKAEEILFMNKMKLEEQQRREFEARQLENAERLKELSSRHDREKEKVILQILICYIFM
jgi:hypothetical protein